MRLRPAHQRGVGLQGFGQPPGGRDIHQHEGFLGAKLCCEKIRLSLWSCLLDLGPCDQVCDLGEGLCIGRMSGHAHKGSFENSIAFQEGLVYVVK